MGEKLVRDGIPDIIRHNGESPSVRFVENESYKEALAAKLQEELEELLEEPCTEEAADLLEVLYAFCKAHEIDLEAVELARQKKFLEKGGFKDGKVLTLD